MAKLQDDIKVDEEAHKLDGKATKNQRTEKKEFRRKVMCLTMCLKSCLDSKAGQKEPGLFTTFCEDWDSVDHKVSMTKHTHSFI